MNKNEMDCVILGSFGGGNAGDMLILDSIIELLRQSGHNGTIWIPSSTPTKLQQLYGQTKVKVIDISWRSGAYRFMSAEMLRVLARPIIVVCTAGIFFDRALFHPAKNFVLSMWLLNRTSKLQHRIHRTTGSEWIGIGVGVSAPKTFMGRYVLGDLFKRFELIMTRDNDSAQSVRRLTSQPYLTVGIDATWNPALLPSDTGEILEGIPNISSREVALNPNRYWENIVGADRLAEVFAELIVYMRQAGYGVTWYCTNIGDEMIADRINATVLDEPLSVLGPTRLEPRKLFNCVKQFRLVIGSRLHSCLFPIIHSVPTLALAYDRKVSSCLADLGLKKHLVSPDNFDGRYLIESVESLLQNPEAQLEFQAASETGRAAFRAMAATLESYLGS